MATVRIPKSKKPRVAAEGCAGIGGHEQQPECPGLMSDLPDAIRTTTISLPTADGSWTQALSTWQNHLCLHGPCLDASGLPGAFVRVCDFEAGSAPLVVMLPHFWSKPFAFLPIICRCSVAMVRIPRLIEKWAPPSYRWVTEHGSIYSIPPSSHTKKTTIPSYTIKQKNITIMSLTPWLILFHPTSLSN